MLEMISLYLSSKTYQHRTLNFTFSVTGCAEPIDLFTKVNIESLNKSIHIVEGTVMEVNPAQLLENGYIILPQVIPPKQLDHLRHSFETLVERQKIVWAKERNAEDPSGGVWETSAQPRVFFNEVVDQETDNTVQLCLHQNTLGVSQKLMSATNAAVTLMALMCNPVKDHGPASWHRDIDPVHQAPLNGMQMDTIKNAPGYVQWNIPLYDDDVFWIVPGSHRRPNTTEEHQHLLTRPQKPIPGGIPVELKAGDGVVYSHIMLHWGSNYSTKLRRTIHLGYRAFGSPVYPIVNHYYWQSDFAQKLSRSISDQFTHFSQLHSAQCDLVESIFRAVETKKAGPFLEGIYTLHPGEEGRMVCLIFLSKLADKVRTLKQPETQKMSVKERTSAISEHRLNFYLFEDFAQRFTVDEANLIWQRFATLYELIQKETSRAVLDLSSRVERYQLVNMPINFNLPDFIQSWEN